jgi:hypothetical protein
MGLFSCLARSESAALALTAKSAGATHIPSKTVRFIMLRLPIAYVVIHADLVLAIGLILCTATLKYRLRTSAWSDIFRQ